MATTEVLERNDCDLVAVPEPYTPPRLMLPIGQLVESPTNPRKTFRHLEELAASIQANPLGIVEPLVVRPHGPVFYVSAGSLAGSLEDSPVRYVAVRNLVGRENLLETFSGGTAEENQARAEVAVSSRNAERKYEIVAGARRFRAARLAGLQEVPVTIVTLTDDQVLETQIIENLQRDDPDPLEEAEGYHALAARGYSVPQIAERVGAKGRHRSYIYRRMALVDLIPVAKDALRAGRITVRHAQRIAAVVAEESQAKAYEMCFPTVYRSGPAGWKEYPQLAAPPVAEALLAQRIKEHLLLDLSAARWKLDDAELLPEAGACRGWLKSSAAQPEFYPAEGEESGPRKKKPGRPRKTPSQPKPGFCLDRACFQAKRRALIQVDVDRAAAAGTPLVQIADFGIEAKELPDGALAREEYTVVPGKRCRHAEKAVLIAGGRELGEHRWICRAKACPQHGRQVHGRAAKPSLAEERSRAQEHLKEKIDTATREELLRRVAAGDSELGRAATDQAQAIALSWIIQRAGSDGRRELLKALRLDVPKSNACSPESAALEAYVADLAPGAKLRFLLACAVADPYAAKKLADVAALLGVVPAAVRKEIAAPLEEAFRKRWAAREKNAAKKNAAQPKGKAKGKAKRVKGAV